MAFLAVSKSKQRKSFDLSMLIFFSLWAGIRRYGQSVVPWLWHNISQNLGHYYCIFAMTTHVTVNSVVDWGHMWFERLTCKSFIMVLVPRVKQPLWVNTDSDKSSVLDTVVRTVIRPLRPDSRANKHMDTWLISYF